MRYLIRWWHPRLHRPAYRRFTQPRAWQEATRFHRAMRQHQATLLNEFGHAWTGALDGEQRPVWALDGEA